MQHFTTNGEHRCGGNMSWISTDPATPELPLSLKKRENLYKAHYTMPTPFKLECVIAVEKSITKKEVLQLIKDKKLLFAKPAEHLHAWWLGFATSVRAEDAESIKLWSKYARSAALVFKDLSEEDASWASMKQREDVRTDYENLRCTPMLRLVHFIWYKGLQDLSIATKPHNKCNASRIVEHV